MKPKHLIPLFLLPALAALGSCISPQDEPGECQDCDLQQIALQVQENGGASTRAGRPLYSNEQDQQVDHVALYICYYGNLDGQGQPIAGKENNKIAAVKHIDNWASESKDYANGRRDYLVLMGESRVPEGATYKIYAIGYTYNQADNTKTEYTVTPEEGTTANLEDYLKGLKKGDTFPENLVLGLTSAAGEEIFAGTNTEDDGLIRLNPVGGFTTTVVLHRQVAGVYVYVKDIPQRDEAKTLRLTAACDNDGLVLGEFDSEDYGQGQGTGKKVVNGTTPKEGIGNTTRSTVCSIDFTQWKDATTGQWKNPYDEANQNPAFVEGSYFVGSFVIPFAAPTQATGSTEEVYHSLQLELLGEDGTVLKTWPVLLSDEDPQVKEQFTRYTWDNTEFKEENITETREAYSLLRNHLYCIGSKDTDGDTDDDEPLPLSNANEIILEAVAEWDVIYDMVLEPER